MHKLIQHGCLLLCALPVAASADPVTVVTRSTGTVSVNPTVLSALGWDYTGNENELPYTLRLSSTYDWTGPLPARDDWASGYDNQVVVDLRIGSYDYHYAGTEWSNTILFTSYVLGDDGYEHEVWTNPNPDAYGYSFNFTHAFFGPAGSMGPGGALTPRLIEQSASNRGFLDVTAYYSNDEYTFSFPLSGAVDSFSVEVTSPVPEPAPFALLAAGVLTLGLRPRMKKGAEAPLG